MPELPSELLVGSWMNAPDYRIRPEATVDEALTVMRQEQVRHLLVMHDDDLVGVVTDRDLRRPDWEDGRPLSIHELYLVGQDLRVFDVMTEDVLTMSPYDTTAHASQVMVSNKINCLPVVSNDAVVGILTSTDLLAALVHAADPELLEAAEVGS